MLEDSHLKIMFLFVFCSTNDTKAADSQGTIVPLYGYHCPINRNKSTKNDFTYQPTKYKKYNRTGDLLLLRSRLTTLMSLGDGCFF